MIYGTEFIREDGNVAHTYGSWGMLQVGPAIISPPKVQTKFIEVTGRDGSLDYTTALDGNVHYESRDFETTLRCVATRAELPIIYSKILNFLHGRKLKAICDDDQNYYWEGRFEAKAPKWKKGYWEIDIKGTVDPYKYSRSTTMGDWLWDPFVFETDIAWDYAGLIVDEQLEVVVATSNMPTTPIFRLSAPMRMVVNGDSEYNLPKGDSTIPGMVLTDTDTTLVFYGDGEVTIGFRGGSL